MVKWESPSHRVLFFTHSVNWRGNSCQHLFVCVYICNAFIYGLLHDEIIIRQRKFTIRQHLCTFIFSGLQFHELECKYLDVMHLLSFFSLFFFNVTLIIIIFPPWFVELRIFLFALVTASLVNQNVIIIIYYYYLQLLIIIIYFYH